jgi:hypothetical protein
LPAPPEAPGAGELMLLCSISAAAGF